MACELMQREIENSQGDSILFTTRQLAASKALDLQVELIGKLGTIVFPFIDNKYNFGDIINLMGQAENSVVTDLMKRVISNASVEGIELKPALFDVHFSGELMLACKAFAFVCEANFHDFFKQGLDLNEQRKLEAAALSKQEEQQNSSPEKI